MAKAKALVNRTGKRGRNEHHRHDPKRFNKLDRKQQNVRIHQAALHVTNAHNMRTQGDRNIPVAEIWTVAGTHGIPPERVQEIVDKIRKRGFSVIFPKREEKNEKTEKKKKK